MDTLLTLDRFDRPAFLWLALVVVLVGWMSRRSLAGLGPIRSRLCLATRCLVLFLLILAIAGTHTIRKTEDLNVLFLLDVSKSVPAATRRQAEAFVTTACRNMKPNDRAAVLTFDGQTNIEQLPSRPGPDGGVHVSTPLPDGQRPDQTNLSQSLRMAAACALDSTNNRIVLLSDGNQNVGDVLTEAKNARANNMTIDVVPLSAHHGPEIVFEQLKVPAYAKLHEYIPLRMIIRSDRPTTGRIMLYKQIGGRKELVDLDPQDSKNAGRVVELHGGRNSFQISLPIEIQRAHEFFAEFIPDESTADGVVENNQAQAFTNVEGPQNVLIIGTERDRPDDQLLVEALIRENIRTFWATPEGATLSPAVLQDYSTVILSNVGADQFSSTQQRALATYVRDLGGGLIMIGGDDSFGAGGWQGSIVEDVMPVRFDVDAVRQIPRGALVIVMHSCEMPQGNKWGIETAVAALKTISRLDYYGVVGWGATGFHWEVPMQIASNKQAIIQQIRKMQNADMFDFQTPMTMAYKALMNRRDAAQRHMIIISDGDPQRPSSGLLNKMVGNRVTCSTVSIFPHGGAQIGTLKWIAKITHGNYWSLSRPGDEQRLPKIFIKEAKIVRRPLIRDEPFVPKIRPHLSDIMTGIVDPLPELKGYVVTTPRKSADIEMPLVTKRGDPLLAHWLCGAGHAVAFTSGRWKHWGTLWPEWSSFSKLWSQVVRWSMRQGTAANFDIQTSVDGDDVHLLIESVDDVEGQGHFRRFIGGVIKPDGNTANLSFAQTGPGRYEARFKMTQKGTYLAVARSPQSSGDQKPIVIRTGVTVAYSPEYKDLSQNQALLREIADQAKGRVLTMQSRDNRVFAHNLPPTISRTPIWDLLLKLTILAFLLDVAFRRIAIDPIKVLATTRAYIAGLPGRFGAGKRAEATLSDLRHVRKRVRAERTAEGDAQHLTQSIPLSGGGAKTEDSPTPDAAHKFDAGGTLKTPGKDLANALGGHTGAAGGPMATQTPAKSTEGEEKPQESTTSRLLKAKKRAQDQQKDEEP